MNTISELKSQDFDMAYAIEKICHTHPWSEKTFLSNQGPHYLNYKISQNDQIVGYCIIQIVLDEASLFNLAIHPQYQRQGLAKKLLSYALEQLSIRQISTIWLEVRASNQAAIQLYEQLGFNQFSIRKNYYPIKDGQREDALIMANTLLFTSKR